MTEEYGWKTEHEMLGREFTSGIIEKALRYVKFGLYRCEKCGSLKTDAIHTLSEDYNTPRCSEVPRILRDGLMPHLEKNDGLDLHMDFNLPGNS